MQDKCVCLRYMPRAIVRSALFCAAGHDTEIVCLSFNPQSTTIATGSMDNTAKV